MIDRRTLLLLAGCALFAAVIGGELRGGSGASAAAKTVAARGDPVAIAQPPPRPPGEKLIASVLARPLFSPTRRPPATSGPVVEELTNNRLTGIVIAPGRRLAIFAVTGAKPVTLTEGGIVNGWQIETITPHEVSLRGPTGIRTLQPKMDASFALQQLSSSFANTGGGAAIGGRLQRTAGPIDEAHSRRAPSRHGENRP